MVLISYHCVQFNYSRGKKQFWLTTSLATLFESRINLSLSILGRKTSVLTLERQMSPIESLHIRTSKREQTLAVREIQNISKIEQPEPRWGWDTIFLKFELKVGKWREPIIVWMEARLLKIYIILRLSIWSVLHCWAATVRDFGPSYGDEILPSELVHIIWEKSIKMYA